MIDTLMDSCGVPAANTPLHLWQDNQYTIFGKIKTEEYLLESTVTNADGNFEFTGITYMDEHQNVKTLIGCSVRSDAGKIITQGRIGEGPHSRGPHDSSYDPGKIYTKGSKRVYVFMFRTSVRQVKYSTQSVLV